MGSNNHIKDGLRNLVRLCLVAEPGFSCRGGQAMVDNDKRKKNLTMSPNHIVVKFLYKKGISFMISRSSTRWKKKLKRENKESRRSLTRILKGSHWALIMKNLINEKNGPLLQFIVFINFHSNSSFWLITFKILKQNIIKKPFFCTNISDGGPRLHWKCSPSSMGCPQILLH